MTTTAIESRWHDGDWILNHATWVQAEQDIMFLLAEVKRLGQDLDLAKRPEHELYARCFQTQEELLAYRERQRAHGARRALDKVRKTIECGHKGCHRVAVTVINAENHHGFDGQTHDCCGYHSGLDAR